ncbi:MAG: hypothetical protein ABI859_18855, partial [Pseudomonadota bacterium]
SDTRACRHMSVLVTGAAGFVGRAVVAARRNLEYLTKRSTRISGTICLDASRHHLTPERLAEPAPGTRSSTTPIVCTRRVRRTGG